MSKSLIDSGELKLILKNVTKVKIKELNNTELMHNFIVDLCDASSPERGIQFSDKYLKLMNSLKAYNLANIYNHKRIKMYKKYAELVITSIFEVLKDLYRKDNLYRVIKKEIKYYPILLGFFSDWIVKYSNFRDRIESGEKETTRKKYNNDIIYNLFEEKDYMQAIIDFIAGMTDNFAIKAFNEITSF